MNLLTYERRSKNPVNYLNKLNKFIQRELSKTILVQGDNLFKNKEGMHNMMDSNLKGHANKCWQFSKHCIEDWIEFGVVFKLKYWNREIQKELNKN